MINGNQLRNRITAAPLFTCIWLQASLSISNMGGTGRSRQCGVYVYMSTMKTLCSHETTHRQAEVSALRGGQRLTHLGGLVEQRPLCDFTVRGGTSRKWEERLEAERWGPQKGEEHKGGNEGACVCGGHDDGGGGGQETERVLSGRNTRSCSGISDTSTGLSGSERLTNHTAGEPPPTRRNELEGLHLRREKNRQRETKRRPILW